MSKEIVSEAPAAYGIAQRIAAAMEPWCLPKRCSEADYLALETNQLIEFTDGALEVLPMPNELHQTMAVLLVNMLLAFSPRGKALSAPFRLNLQRPSGNYREPDVIYLMNRADGRRAKDVWTGADLVMEIVSPGGEQRDYIEKRADYAGAGISEYWIIDPELRTITVLKLDGTQYIEHGNFALGQVATSVLLPGFSVDVTAIFNAE